MYTANVNQYTLLDYLDNPDLGKSQLSALGDPDKPSQTHAARDIQASLVDLDGIDGLVDKMMSGESAVDHNAIADMLDFYHQQVSREVEKTARDMGLTEMPGFAMVDGKWQTIAASEPDGKQQQFLDYLNRDQRLGERVERLAALTQLNEISASQIYAANLTQADTDEQKVQAYLKDSRSQILAHNYVGLEDGQFRLGSIGLATDTHEQHFAQ